MGMTARQGRLKIIVFFFFDELYFQIYKSHLHKSPVFRRQVIQVGLGDAYIASDIILIVLSGYDR